MALSVPLQNGPTCKDKLVYLDQGGELYANPDAKNVFTNWHYKIHPSGTDSLHQNGHVKRAHRSVGDHTRALLTGAALDINIWPYKFSTIFELPMLLLLLSKTPPISFKSLERKRTLLTSAPLAVDFGSAL